MIFRFRFLADILLKFFKESTWLYLPHDKIQVKIKPWVWQLLGLKYFSDESGCGIDKCD